ncbi:MAG: hypothetical protein QNK23_08020 [Crocinitomicaceae bacterium]|nr:hypothetical protein [Crocinitomicaceae bacterium]
MKHLILFIFLIPTLFSRADQWDNLTHEEAEAVIVYLHDNPYIFEYCDCCDNEDDKIFKVKLVRAFNAKIVICSWNSEMYSVEYEFETLAEMQYEDDGGALVIEIPYETFETTHTVYMNYTWGLNAESKKAQPLFDSIEYNFYGEDPTPCKRLFEYPTANDLSEVGKFKAYKQWYNNYVN